MGRVAVLGLSASTGPWDLHGSLDGFSELEQLRSLALVLRAHLLEFSREQESLLGEVGLAYLSESLSRRAQFTLKLLNLLLLHSKMLVLYLNLGSHPGSLLLEALILTIFQLDSCGKVLHFFISSATLLSLILDLLLELRQVSVQFFDISILVLELTLKKSVLLCLPLLSILFKRGFQFLQLLEGAAHLCLVI